MRPRATAWGGDRHSRPSARACARLCSERPDMTELDLFQTHRAALFAVAYRMLGSATDAEDVLQDAWLRFSSAQATDLRSVKAYLTTIVTRLCLDRLKS